MRKCAGRAKKFSASRLFLLALVALREERDVEGQLGVGLLLLLAVRVLAQHRALRVDAQPAAMRALEDVRKNALFINLTVEFTLWCST